MKNIDLIFSLGPNCRSTWNLRNYYGLERAYPFDWWITPVKSVLNMIESGYKFKVERDDLFLSPINDPATVYNYKLNLLHHHDFPRVNGSTGSIIGIKDEDILNINQKYIYLFNRFFDDVKSSTQSALICRMIAPI